MKSNIQVWEGLYAEGKNLLKYPDDTFLKMYFSELRRKAKVNVLDFGAGAGAISQFLVDQGEFVTAYDPSSSARQVIASKLGATANIIDDEQYHNLPKSSFDCIVAWQVLYYLEEGEFSVAVHRLKELLRPGGQLLATFIGEGDTYVSSGERVKARTIRLDGAGQKGAEILLFDRGEYENLLKFDQVRLGEFKFSFDGRENHYHIVLASK